MIEKKYILTLSFFFILYYSFSQNLINNPSFEQIWICPHSFVSEANQKPFPEWINPNSSTPDVFHICSDFDAAVPKNFTGILYPADGNAYAGIVLWEQFFKGDKTYNINSREYLQTKLETPLKRNKLYCIKFYYANAQRTLFSCNGLGVALTKKPIKAFNGNIIVQRPQVLNNPNHIMDNTEWTEFCASYRADGNESYFTIGNFFDNEETVYQENKRSDLDSNLVYAYYLIDDVKVYEIDYISECGCLNDFALSYDPFDDSFDKNLGYNIFNNNITDNNNKQNTDQNNNENQIVDAAFFNDNVNENIDNEIDNNNTSEKNTDNVNLLLLKKSDINEEKITNSKIGDKFLLNRIFFEFNSFDLLAVSNFELDKLFDILEKNPNIKIEIAGHTDNIGYEKYNKNLSLKRAETVCNYLKNKGINQNRMKFKGFGSTMPIADNNSDEGRRKNRRVEIIITEK